MHRRFVPLEMAWRRRWTIMPIVVIFSILAIYSLKYDSTSFFSPPLIQVYARDTMNNTMHDNMPKTSQNKPGNMSGSTAPSCHPSLFTRANNSNECLEARAGAAPSSSENDTILVIYSFYFNLTTNISDIQVQNLQFFTTTAVLDAPNIDFLFLMAANDPNEAELIFANHSHPLWAEVFPVWVRKMKNVRIIFTKNGYYDLCSYTMLFQSEWFIQNRYNYTKIFFINSTVRGPLIPPYLYLKINWWDVYLDRFNESPDVALVGTMVSCYPNPHVQSYTLAMDQRALQIAMNTWNCPHPSIRKIPKRRTQWIHSTEVAFSTNVVKAGHTFLATASLFYDWDGKQLSTKNCKQRNPTMPGGYAGWFPTPYDAVFIKTGGDISRLKGGVHQSILLATKTASEACLRLSEKRRQLNQAKQALSG